MRYISGTNTCMFQLNVTTFYFKKFAPNITTENYDTFSVSQFLKK